MHRRIATFTAKAHVYAVATLQQLSKEDAEVPWLSNGSDLIGHDDSDEVLPAACARVACPPCCVSEIGGFLGYKLNGHHIVARQVFEAQCDQEPTSGSPSPTRALLHCATCGAFTQQKAICLRRQ